MQIEHEVHERTLEAGTEVPVDGESRAGDLGRPFEIEDPEALSQFPVRLGSEIELRWCAPAANLDVVIRTMANWDTGVWKIWDARQDVAQPRVRFFGDFLGAGDLLL